MNAFAPPPATPDEFAGGLDSQSVDAFGPVGGPIFGAIDGKRGHHAPTIAALPDGSLLVGWYSYDGPSETRGAEIFLSRQTNPADPAAAWSTPQRVISGPLSYGNPVLFVDDDALRLFFAAAPGTWSAGSARQVVSRDNGQTWGSPKVVSNVLGANVRNPPLRRNDGSLLLPAYDDLLQRTLLLASDDGEKWTLENTIEPPFPARLIQAALARTDGRRWILAARNTARGGTWFAASADEGRTWSIALQDEVPNPGAALALLPLGDDRYVLIFNNSRTDRTSLAAALAVAGGVRWIAPKTIIEGRGEYAYPAAAIDSRGVIHLVFSRDRQAIEHRALSPRWLTSPEP